jgi:hypothetical protein
MGTKWAVGIGLLALAGSGAYIVLNTYGVGSSGSLSVKGEVAVKAGPVMGLRVPAEPAATIDGVTLDGTLLVATAQGVRAAGDTHVLTFGPAEITAVTVHRNHLVLGAADGALTIVSSTAGQRVRFADAAPVTELASDGARIYVGTSDGLLVWDGKRAVRTTEIGAVTAMAVGPEGVAVGTASGELWLASGLRVERMRARLDGHVTALAWDGDSLLAGTPFALQRVTGDHVRTIRRDLSVTAILVDGARVIVGTLDDGVVRIEEDGREHRLVGRERVRRLRWIDGRPVAFGDGGAWDLSGPAAQRLV